MADKKKISEIIQSLGLLYDKEVSVELARLYWEDLQAYGNEDLDVMVSAHRQDPDRGRFFPKPADLIAKARTKAPKHLPADAAWAVAVRSFDENDTILWTDEIAQARQLALTVWNTKDRVGARMAFKAAYEMILARLPTSAVPKWQISAGHDPQGRLEAVERAQASGLISSDQADRLLPHYLKPVAPEVTEGMKQLTGAKNQGVVQFPPNDFIRKLRETLDVANKNAAESEAERERKAHVARLNAMAARKAKLHAIEKELEGRMEPVTAVNS